MGSICKKISWHTWIFATHSLLSLLCRQVNVRTEARSARSKRAETQYRTMIMVSHFDSWGCCGGCWRPIQGVLSKSEIVSYRNCMCLKIELCTVNPEITENGWKKVFTQIVCFLYFFKLISFYKNQNYYKNTFDHWHCFWLTSTSTQKILQYMAFDLLLYFCQVTRSKQFKVHRILKTVGG